MDFSVGTFVALVAAFVTAGLTLRFLSGLANPLVNATRRTSRELSQARMMARAFPEGQLFNVMDPEIRMIGEAMLIDGESTKTINILMLDLWREKLIKQIPDELVWQWRPVQRYPGYPENG